MASSTPHSNSMTMASPVAYDPELIALIEASYRPRAAQPQGISPEVFGRLLAVAWGAETGRKDLPPRPQLTQILLSSDHVPDEMRDALHVEKHADGPSIVEYTRYMASAQEVGLIERFNPHYNRTALKIEPHEAAHALSSYLDKYPAVVTWLRDLIRRANVESQPSN